MTRQKYAEICLVLLLAITPQAAFGTDDNTVAQLIRDLGLEESRRPTHPLSGRGRRRDGSQGLATRVLQRPRLTGRS